MKTRPASDAERRFCASADCLDTLAIGDCRLLQMEFELVGLME